MSQKPGAIIIMIFGAVLFAGLTYDAGDASAFREGPRIRFLEDRFDLGKVVEGQDVFHIFKFVNEGDDTLVVEGFSLSCNCIVPMLNTSRFPPKDTGLLKVVLRSAGREGKIAYTITVRSNDKESPLTDLHLYAEIEKPENVHKGAMHSPEKLASIFSGDCRICHVNNGLDVLGKELLDADCAICHGTPRHSKPASELTSASMLKLTTEEVREIIAQGRKESTMPGFSQEKGGPLTTVQIESLVRLLKPGTNIR